MATVKDSIPHVVRTAHEPRQAGFWGATLGQIQQVNSSIRLLRLNLQIDGSPPLRHLPGQYVDLHIPGIESIGGFTITSPPQTASNKSKSPYIELAVQKSPRNPPAAFLWRSEEEIIGSSLSFRIGGTFVYPPLSLTRAEFEKVSRVVFVAGGVGINPIMSMLSAMDSVGAHTLGGMLKSVRILYSSRRSILPTGETEEILFEKRLIEMSESWATSQLVDYQYTLFETSKVGRDLSDQGKEPAVEPIRQLQRRILPQDLFHALGPEEDRKHTIIYVCGVPTMTDEFVNLVQKAPGIEERRVFCEKWW